MIAVPELAKRMGCSVDEVITISLRSEGPTLNNATTPNEVRFHDDISTYTGKINNFINYFYIYHFNRCSF